MAVAPPPIKLTWDDYKLFPNDGRRHELIDGQHIMSPSPKSKHQDASSNLFWLLQSFIRPRRLGRLYAAPFDVIFSQFDVVEPDLLFIAALRVKKLVKDWVRGAPDLVVEILSPSMGEIDRSLKFKQYEKFGVREYWLVDPEIESVEIFVLRDSGYELLTSVKGKQRVKSEALAGLDFVAHEIFDMD
jgi:Uma2 family endonuclease